MPQPERRKTSGALLWILQVVVALAALLTFRSRPRRPPGVDPEDLAEGYEHSDIRPGVVLGGAAALLVVVAVVVVAITAFEASVTGVPPRISPPDELSKELQSGPARVGRAPALEAQAGQNLGQYLAVQRQRLSTYRWVDRRAGLVAIPIDRAMDLVAEQGLPARPAPADLGNRAPSVSSSGRVDEAYP